MHKNTRIYVAGHRGLVGSAIVRRLQAAGYHDVVTRSRADLDLTDPVAVNRFFAQERPEYVFGAAAKVGGIMANKTYPADFIRDNLLIELNLIEAARQYGVGKFLMLGSSCIYPRNAAQPIKEDYLLGGHLEPTNEPYAVAKIAGISLAQSYRRQYGMKSVCLMPTNLYGPGDNFDLNNSHVLPALIRKFHEAKVSGSPHVVLWGTGTPRREFLHVDDMADACVFLMQTYDQPEIVNVGTGEDITIREAAELIADVVGFKGELVYDTTKPDGTPRKMLDVTRLHSLGWKARRPLREGVEETYNWYVTQQVTGSAAVAAAARNGSVRCPAAV